MTVFNSSKLPSLVRRVRAGIFFVLPAMLAYVAGSPELPAGFSNHAVRTHVEIDGTDYGLFDGVIGIEDGVEGAAEDGYVRRVVLQRDFVTDPSLYLWAKNTMRERTGLKDINIVMENRDGDEIARYILKSCQPVSWSVEAAALSSGGFHERIELAVQGVEVE
ncbi:MAG: T4-like virus tail tube protein gp19 [Pseudomonadota bacterium]